MYWLHCTFLYVNVYSMSELLSEQTYIHTHQHKDTHRHTDTHIDR